MVSAQRFMPRFDSAGARVNSPLDQIGARNMTDYAEPRRPGIVWWRGLDWRGAWAAPAGEVCERCRTPIAPEAVCYYSTYGEALCVPCALIGDMAPVCGCVKSFTDSACIAPPAGTAGCPGRYPGGAA